MWLTASPVWRPGAWVVLMLDRFPTSSAWHTRVGTQSDGMLSSRNCAGDNSPVPGDFFTSEYLETQPATAESLITRPQVPPCAVSSTAAMRSVALFRAARREITLAITRSTTVPMSSICCPNPSFACTLFGAERRGTEANRLRAGA